MSPEEQRQQSGQPQLTIEKIPNDKSFMEIFRSKVIEFLDNLKQEYKEYIVILKKDYQDIIQKFIESFNVIFYKPEVFKLDAEASLLVSKLLAQAQGTQDKQEAILQGIAEVFLDNLKKTLESSFKTFLADLLLADSTILEDEDKKKKVLDFINKHLSIEELTKIVGIVTSKDLQRGIAVVFDFIQDPHLQISFYEVQDYWKNILPVILLQKIRDVDELKKYFEALKKTYIKNLEQLKEALSQSEWLREIVRREYMSKHNGKEPTQRELNRLVQERVEQIVESIQKLDVGELTKLPPGQLEQLKNYFQSIGKLAEEIKEEKVEESRKEKIKEAIGNFITITGGLGLSGFLLWFAFFGFFLPLWLIEKIRPQIEKVLK